MRRELQTKRLITYRSIVEYEFSHARCDCGRRFGREGVAVPNFQLETQLCFRHRPILLFRFAEGSSSQFRGAMLLNSFLAKFVPIPSRHSTVSA
jgi:hypothetical protein